MFIEWSYEFQIEDSDFLLAIINGLLLYIYIDVANASQSIENTDTEKPRSTINFIVGFSSSSSGDNRIRRTRGKDIRIMGRKE
jgi:hypothetical protein